MYLKTAAQNGRWNRSKEVWSKVHSPCPCVKLPPQRYRENAPKNYASSAF
uniref:Uncharacterized protein n=1 Tax=Magallana gigas TaxID=29159 RepID=K1PN59_MAGGI